jgi:peptidoglycan/LPS O-acetylase OafA/YrhL
LDKQIQILPQNKIYFKGLNGLRFIAASAVIIAHIEGFLEKAGYPNYFSNNVIGQLGSQGVKIFFVISGFLITYLLLSEKNTTKSIEINKFYIRRILRIWPLYFLIVFLGFFIFPYIFSPEYFVKKTEPYFLIKIGLAVFMLPNVLFLAFGHIFSIGILWSIGTEEQFYLLWPHWIKSKLNSKNISIKMLLLIIGIKALLSVAYLFTHNPTNTYLWILVELLEFDCMIIGAITAMILFEKNQKWLDFFMSNFSFFISIAVLFLLLIFKPELYFLKNTIYSILYAVIILNISSNENCPIKLETKPLNYLGNISYGVYMYHALSISLGIYVIQRLNLDFSTFTAHFFVYVLSFVFSVTLAHLSHHYIESKFLSFKERFVVISSTNKN